MLTVTKEDVYNFSPCKAATKPLVDSIFKDAESLSAFDVLACDPLTSEYKLWALLRPELIENGKLEEIRVEFLKMMNQERFIEISKECPVYQIIGRVARCYNRDYEETYKVLLVVVENVLA
jgi:hypothetical protein